NPELLILDEPTNGLDPIGIKEIRSLILSLAKDRNITIFVSSHILSEIEQLATHMGIIHEGRLLEEIAFDKLRERNRNYLERSEEHTSELQSRFDLVCRLLLEKKKK